MGNFSRSTFDRTKHYVGVRLQQGVPIVDADWNELEDVRKYELHTFLRWFVGNGVPEGNDGFAVFSVAEANDFGIRGGDGTADGAGRCLVEGWEVANESDLRFTEQPLFNDAALAAEWGVDPVQPLTTPGSNRQDLVYLDVWEREVDSSEDFGHLVNPAIGVETSVRLRREWAVRVVEGTNAVPAAPEGHFFYPLAVLARTGGNASIPPNSIQDRRRTGINLAAIDARVSDLGSEVSGARGSQASLGQRLDASLAAGGQLRPGVVGNTQVSDGALNEAKVAFDGSTGHDHSGGSRGRQIGASGIADAAILFDKLKWRVVSTGTFNNIAAGASRVATIDTAYEGQIYLPVLTSVIPANVDTTVTVTADVIHASLRVTEGTKFQYSLRVSNASESTGPANVVYHVYTIAET
jgi:hypothetical protein